VLGIGLRCYWARSTGGAWGRVKKGEFEVPNAELGVVFRIESDSDAGAQAIATDLATWQRPCVPYPPKGEPWVRPARCKAAESLLRPTRA
jgi:hypothetical protein